MTTGCERLRLCDSPCGASCDGLEHCGRGAEFRLSGERQQERKSWHSEDRSLQAYICTWRRSALEAESKPREERQERQPRYGEVGRYRWVESLYWPASLADWCLLLNYNHLCLCFRSWYIGLLRSISSPVHVHVRGVDVEGSCLLLPPSKDSKHDARSCPPHNVSPSSFALSLDALHAPPL